MKSLRTFESSAPEHLKKYISKKFESKQTSVLKNLQNLKVDKLRKLKEKFGYGDNSDMRANLENKNKHKKRKFVKKTVWTRRQRKFRNKGTSLYFNYSDIVISPAMDKLLNRGLNYSITPGKVNVTELLIDIDKFVRTNLWKEFFFDSPKTDFKPPIVKTEKNNLPKKHKTPENLKRFLHATTSELLDEKNRNPVTKNLPDDEVKALKLLIDMQKSKLITIKPADKGAGIVILNFEDYLESCQNHLEAKQTQPDGTFFLITMKKLTIIFWRKLKK